MAMATIERNGTLGDNQGIETDVRYSVAVLTSIVRQANLPPGPGPADGRARIAAADGKRFADGMYWLKTEQGQQIRLQKLGAEWYVLAPMP